MPEPALRIVDALTLPDPIRRILMPGQPLDDGTGRRVPLPRYFYEVTSYRQAQSTFLAPHFRLWEFVQADVRESEVLRDWPRYVPCAASLLAAVLSSIRQRLGTYVHIAANGGYRSPGHALCTGPEAIHAWGTSADLYRIGDTWLHTEEACLEGRRRLRDILPGLHIAPYGAGPGQADDHLHVSLGPLVFAAHDFPPAPPDAEPWLPETELPEA